MKIAFCTVVKGKSFEETFSVFLYSLRKHNPSLDLPFHVVHNDLSEETQKKFKTLYPNMYFQSPDEEFYKKYEKGACKFWAFEAYRFTQYDRVIFLDADLLCLNKMDQLIKANCGIGMHWESYRPCYNSGVVTIGKEYLNEETFMGLLTMVRDPKRFGYDQQIINRYFEGKVFEIPIVFNTLASEARDSFMDKIVLLHYIYKPNVAVGIKQLQPKLKVLWERYRDEHDRLTKSS